MIMEELIGKSLFFGVAVSVVGYETGLWIKKRVKSPLCNPLLISIAFVMVVLSIFRVDYNDYYEGGKYLSYLLTPATVCLAVPLYQQMELLKKNWAAVITAIVSGVFSSLTTVFIMSKLFGFTHEQYVTLLPKSITTAIGMGVSEKLEGIVTVTVVVIIITGILGNVIAEGVFKLFRIQNPIAKGLALGTSAHAIGTAKAMELGEIEGAMSSLSIVVSGILTVAAAPLFAGLL